jgi:uncharacterized membrane protein YfcA
LGDGTLELVGFGILCFAVAVAGGLAGLVLGNMRLPFATAIAPTVAAGGGANVAISGVAALAAATKHARDGRINWRMFWWLAPPSLIGALVGGYTATVVPADALRLFIATVLFYGSWELANWQPAARAEGDAEEQATNADRTATIVIGLIVGLLGGAVGLILGSLRMPALLRFTKEQPQILVGTSLAAGVVVGAAGAVGHLLGGNGSFDWQLFVVGAVASVPGAWLGAHLTGRLSPTRLVHTIAAIVFVAALTMLLQVVI